MKTHPQFIIIIINQTPPEPKSYLFLPKPKSRLNHRHFFSRNQIKPHISLSTPPISDLISSLSRSIDRSHHNHHRHQHPLSTVNCQRSTTLKPRKKEKKREIPSSSSSLLPVVVASGHRRRRHLGVGRF